MMLLLASHTVPSNPSLLHVPIGLLCVKHYRRLWAPIIRRAILTRLLHYMGISLKFVYEKAF